jgi:hypothetical protein
MSETITPVTVIGDSAIGGTAPVDSGDITVVAGNLSAIDIVSNNMDSVVADAESIDAINSLASSKANLLNLNNNLSTIETVNSKLGEINRYYTTFLGTSDTDPTVRVDGSPLQVGDMYYSTTMPGMKVRGATAWATSGGGVPVNNGSQTGNSLIENLTVSGAFNANGYAQFNSSSAFKIPAGTTAERPAPAGGQLRFNTTTNEFEGYNGLVWGGIGGTTSGGSSGSSATSYVRQTFTATAGQTTFTVTGGYTPGKIDVFKNGIKLVNGSTVTVTSGSSVVLSAGASVGDIIDVVGLASGYFSSPAIPKRLSFTATAAQTLFTVAGGYTPNQLDVFQNGTKLVTGTDVDVSNGTSFTLVTPATAGDTLEIVGFTAADTLAGTLKFQSGTATAPSITTFGDENTGIYFPAADTLALTTNGTPRVLVNSAGATTFSKNVSINQTASDYNALSLTNTSGVQVHLNANGNSEGNLRTVTDHPLTFSTLNTEKMRIDSSGNVGVGTTSPTGKLDVSGGNIVNKTTAAGTTGLLLSNGTAGAGLSCDFSASNTYLDIKSKLFIRDSASAYATRMNIDSSGNVGIGETNPANPLHIKSASTIANATWAGGTDFIKLTAAPGSAFSEQAIAFQESTYNVGAKIGAKNTANGAYDIIFANRANTSTTSPITEKMRIDSSGNVNIGTESVNTLRYLDVSNGNTGANAGSILRLVTSNVAESGNTSVDIVKYKNGQFAINNNDTNAAAFTSFNVGASERLRIDSSGNVGIGTTIPGTKLDVLATANSGLRVTNGTMTGIFFNSADTSIAIGSQTNHPVNLYANNSVAATILANGNLGVGAQSPSTKLEVSGRIRITANTDPALEINNGTVVKGYLYHDTTGPDSINLRHASAPASQFVLKSSGNVGIGKSDPTEKLDVDGNAKVSGTMTVGTKVIRSTVYPGFTPASTTRTIEFTGIPSDAEELKIILVGLSMSNTDVPYIQLGTASGYVGAGAYFGGTIYHSNAGISASEHTNAAFLFDANSVQTYSYYGKYVITKVSSNYWHIQGTAQDTLGGRGGGCNSGVSFTGPLTKVKVEVATGLFDAGSVYCIY